MSRPSLIACFVSAFLVAAAQSAPAQTQRRFEAEIAAGQLAEDTLLEARLAFLLFGEVGGVGCNAGGTCETAVKVVAQVPIRFEVVDDAPSDEEIVRTEDWDDPGDFFRIVRLLEYGRPTEPLHVRFGELGGVRVGHGTIVNGLLNNVSVGDFRPGLEAHANSLYGGIQVVVDDVTAPHLVGGRGYVRPWGFADRTAWWHRLAFGVTAVSDFRAPTRLDDGAGEVGFRDAPPVAEEEPVTIAGVDAELSLIDEGTFTLLPYMDGNVASTGLGAHAGAAATWRPNDRFGVGLRLEGRLFGPGYVPDYFGPLYAIERYRMTGWNVPIGAPKARVAASTPGGYGGFAQLSLSLTNVGSLSIAASEHDGARDTSAWARLSITPPLPFVLGAYVARTHVDADEPFALDGTVLVTESRVTVWGPLYVHGRYDRLWQLDLSGNYDTVSEWFAGVGAQLDFGDTQRE